MFILNHDNNHLSGDQEGTLDLHILWQCSIAFRCFEDAFIWDDTLYFILKMTNLSKYNL